MTITKAFRRLVTAGFLMLVGVQPALAAGITGDCCDGMQKICCPKYVHCQPKPPWLKFKKVCSTKCLCDPCAMENFGYYPTTWAPWSGTPSAANVEITIPNNFVPPHAGHVAPYHAETMHPLPQ